MKNYSKRGAEGRRPGQSRPAKGQTARERAGSRNGLEDRRKGRSENETYPGRKTRQEDRPYRREETSGRREREHAPEKDWKNSRTRSEFAQNGPAPELPEESENRLEGRNAVLEAYRSGRTVDKLFLQKDLQDGMILTIAREARKAGSIISYVPKTRLDQMSETGRHQGVIAYASSIAYVEVEDILQRARDKGEDPFLFLLDGIEDPHNLGAIIRTANLAGAHGVIITKHRAAGLTAAVARASAGAVSYTPVAKVGNLGNVIDQLKKEGIWFVCADMGGTRMYDLDLKGPIGLVIGNEGEGVSRLVREKCDHIASIPMKGDIDSLNASVAASVLAYEIVRQRQCDV